MGFENHLISLHTDIKTLLKIRDKIMDINYRFIEKFSNRVLMEFLLEMTLVHKTLC